MDPQSSAHNASLPSFVELMASLGLQDEHTAHALLRGASDEPLEPSAYRDDRNESSKPHSYRNSTASNASLELPLDTPNSVSLSTPLSSASLLTPLNSPPVQRERERPLSHGKKRYSPYGLNGPAVNEYGNQYRDIYGRRGSVPGTVTEYQDVDKRQFHHQSAPYGGIQHHHLDPVPSTDKDGDEEMQDAATSLMSLPNRSQPTMVTTSSISRSTPSSSQTSHCVGQPNLLMSRPQRNPRGVLGPRTKSQSHLRTTTTASSGVSHPFHSHNIPPVPSSDPPSLPVVPATRGKNSSPYSSIGRRSGRTISTSSTSTNAPNSIVNGGGSFIDIGLDDAVGDNAPVVSISSLARRSQPPPASLTIETVPESPSASTSQQPQPSSRPHHLSLPRPLGIAGLTPPPSAPATKTRFGFEAGMNLSGGIGPSRRARHARSSSARSVRDMIREREPLVPLTSLYSFHPLGEESPLPNLSTLKRPPLSRGESSDGTNGANLNSNNASTSSLPLDDTSRSFAHRRRFRRSNKRNSPPPPLMILPTLPMNISIKSIVSNSAAGGEGGDNDRLQAGNAEGYVSRREPHSPDARATWRTRRTTPPMRGVPVGVMESS